MWEESRPYSTSILTPGLRVSLGSVTRRRGYSPLAASCLRQAVLPLLVMTACGGGLLGLFPIAWWASFVSVFSKPHQVSSATKP